MSHQQKRAVGNVKLKESLDYSVHEIVEFKILRTVRGMRNKLTALDFRRRNSVCLFRDLLSKLPWYKKRCQVEGPKKAD